MAYLHSQLVCHFDFCIAQSKNEKANIESAPKSLNWQKTGNFGGSFTLRQGEFLNLRTILRHNFLARFLKILFGADSIFKHRIWMQGKKDLRASRIPRKSDTWFFIPSSDLV